MAKHSPKHLPIMGVAGSGNTTVAGLLADRLGWVRAEADEFHSTANVEKMASGTPLTDEDRWPWLRAIRAYRDILAGPDQDVSFVHLTGSAELIAERMSGRTGHFMPPSLLPSRLSTLEALEPHENGIEVGIAGAPEQITDGVLSRLHLPG
ncbi:gluconokinase [Georgenia yuyongxinii]|uniref:gluconokinase n=1 Tax=Georgenia yuyongxinii TaxID=2589797 RepID=A0A5B8BYT8_9MICO|nr:gluconokinase [Georgenia yuyongxinii]QDC23443.1 gluconokinase [Georgenia yuyongxinii]